MRTTLREAREAVRPRMTQAALARRLGIRQSAVSAYELGTASPPAWRAQEIEEALGVPPGSIGWPRPVSQEVGA